MEHSIGFEKLNSPTIVIDKEEEGEKAPYKREHRVYSLPKAFDFSIATLPQSEMAFKPSPLASEKRHFSDSRRKHHSWDEDDYPIMEKDSRPTKLHLEDPNTYRRGSSGLIGGAKGVAKNRSRSVIIKLQVPRHSPTVNRKSITDGNESLDSSQRERATTFSGVPSPKMCRKNSPKVSSTSHLTDAVSTAKSQTKNAEGEEEDNEDDEICDLSPTFTRTAFNQTHNSRRSSFLYSEDAPFSTLSSQSGMSRATSVSSHIGDETYVTPFAQILANLHRVRSQFITLAEPPISEERKKAAGMCDPPTASDISNEEYKALALSTLDDLDWCLHKLETLNSAKSMGTMAQDKFKKLLSRELSYLSERSRSGHFVAEWVNTIAGTSNDQSEEIDKTLESLNVIDSTLGIELTRQRSTSLAEPASRFGVNLNGLDEDRLQKYIDENIITWEFDAFQLNYLTAGQPLVVLAYTVFSRRGLFIEFKMSKTAFIKFMTAVENNYWKKNPYHNSIHATDVLHAVNYLLNSSALEDIITSLEVLAVLIAATVHDVDHPGRNNQFLVNSMHDLAIMYNDESVLENHHLAVTFKLLQDKSCNFLSNLEKSQMKVLRKIIIDTVLATDMTKHFQHLGELKTMVETKKVANNGILLVDKYSDRSEILQCMLHCADLNNPAKPSEIAHVWASRIMEESFNQGDEEKKLKIDISPLGDRENVSMEKCQVSFIDFIVYPLWETWAELVFPDAQNILEHLTQTREYWYKLTVKSPSPPIESASKSDEDILSPPAQERRQSFKTSKLDAIDTSSSSVSEVR